MKRGVVRVIAAAATFALPIVARAQDSASIPAATRAVLTRAHDLYAAQNITSGRILIDSIMALTKPDAPEYRALLLWDARFGSGDKPISDYHQLIINWPYSPEGIAALEGLGRIELANGDRDAAAAHLSRFIASDPQSADRIPVGFDLGKLLMGMNQQSRGCAAILSTRALVPASSVELANQIDFYARRCDGVDTAAPPPPSPPPDTTHIARATDGARGRGSRGAAPPPARGAPPPKDSTKAPPTPKDTTKPSSGEHFALQVAAYSLHSDADQEATKLKGRGLSARVVGTAKPYRVRIGDYDTRAAADSALASLKTRGITTIVVSYRAEEK